MLKSFMQYDVKSQVVLRISLWNIIIFITKKIVLITEIK